MVEQEIHVIVVAIQRDALLAFDEGEADAELQEKGLDLAQQSVFEIPFAVGISQAEKIENVGVPEDQVGSELVAFAQRLDLLRDELFRLLRKSGALVEHAVDAGAQSSYAPPLDAAHLGVEIPLERVCQRDELYEVAPPQLSRQRRDNLRIGEGSGELHHPAKVLLAKATAEF